MASAKTAWGIEIGQYEVKAIQLEVAGDGVRVRRLLGLGGPWIAAP